VIAKGGNRETRARPGAKTAGKTGKATDAQASEWPQSEAAQPEAKDVRRKANTGGQAPESEYRRTNAGGRVPKGAKTAFLPEDIGINIRPKPNFHCPLPNHA
jgi:hypothetical protein